MRRLAARALLLSTLAFCACSDRSAPREDVASASMALSPPLLGQVESGWRMPPSGDYNGDGVRDILWRNHTDNTWGVWLMAGARVLEQGPMHPGPPDDDWLVVSGGTDLNFDGMSDLIWSNPVANRVMAWLVRGTDLFERGPELPGPPGDGWLCLPCGDFNGDGIGDLLWLNTTMNRMTVWLMRGTEPFERGPEIPGPGDGWVAVFAADFDRDGRADVLWYNVETDRIAVWLMWGTEVRARGAAIPTPPSRSYTIASAGDFNRDFVPDLLWYDRARDRMTISLMYGTELLSQGPEIPGMHDGDWIVGNTIDCNGDGISDVIWLATNPVRVRPWMMRGPVPVAYGPELAWP